MEKYQSYKPSGVEWIGEIPEHWSKTKISYYCKVKDGTHDTPNYVDDGGYPLVTQKDITNGKLDFSKTKNISEDDYLEINKRSNVEFNDIIMSMIGSIGNPTIVETPIKFSIKNVCLFKTSESNEVIRFIHYFLDSQVVMNELLLKLRGGVQGFVSLDVLRNLIYLRPPKIEQLQIVQFLDKKTELIDKLISTKERKIILLKEQRTSLINQVVTKGLNPNVKMKDSGVEWIGEIPEHWGLIKMKHKGDVIIGLSYSPEDIVDEGDGTLVMRSSNVQNGKPSFLDNVYVSSKIPEKIRLKVGDILICSRNGSRNLIGKNCLITQNEEGLTFGVFMTVYRSKYYKFMYWLLNSPIFESQSGLFLTSTINQLTVSTLQNMVLPFTNNENEQNQIVDFLDSKTKEIDDLVELEQKKIDLLKEYRQSLISEVVTGKIKVTN